MIDTKQAQEHLRELGTVLENIVGLAHDGEFHLAELARAMAPQINLEANSKTRPRVLLVDDDGRLLKSLARLFSRDFAVVTASTVAGAISELKRQVFDVALTDFHLPDGSGLMILEEARRDQPIALRLLYTGGAADAPNGTRLATE